jgi:hypothetical protein
MKLTQTQVTDSLWDPEPDSLNTRCAAQSPIPESNKLNVPLTSKTRCKPFFACSTGHKVLASQRLSSCSTWTESIPYSISLITPYYAFS